MRKFLIILLVVSVLLLVVLALIYSPKIQISGSAFLNGKKLPEEIALRKYVFENRDDAIIPLVKSYECLGYLCTWESDTICRIMNDNEEYVLDLTEHTFISSKGRRVGENLLVPPPGENHGVIQVAEKEVYVNTGVFHGMLLRLGTPTRIVVDFGKRQVSIAIQQPGTD